MGLRCKHNYPLLATHIESGRCVRCMGCGAVGPVRTSLPEAIKALRGATLKQTRLPVAEGLSRTGV